MKLTQLQNEIEKLDFKLKTTLKNSNELYVMTTAADIKQLLQTLITPLRVRSFVTEFCRQDEASFTISIVMAHRKEGYFVILQYPTQAEIVSIQDIIYQSHLFEREIADLYGLKINGGRDTRHIVKHESWPANVYPLRKDFSYGEKIAQTNELKNYEFKKVTGEGGYQIPVGPVHAGIIEPGHFRFSVIGEEIENLEIRLMYKHRGIEKISENTVADNLNLVFERVAGESSVAYAEAYALLIEKLTSYNPPEEIKALRVILLELERIYNFLDDIAGICIDVGYSYPAKKYGYFSEQIHQLCERISGSRFMRNSIVPYGININFTGKKAEDIKNTLNTLENRMNSIINMTLENISFLDRVEDTGMIDKETARRLCMTGVVGRACERNYDVRYSFKYEIYRELKRKLNNETQGGVFERYKLKVAEIRDAFSFIQKALSYIKKDIPKTKKEINLPEDKEAMVAVETVKGELVVYGQTGKNNRFNRIHFKTPSFTNWDGLTSAVLDEIVPDFPLCNKSFNMSYSENDR